MDVLSQCKKKTVLKGLLPLLSELKRKKGNLWSFEGDNVKFIQGENEVLESFEDKKEFFACFEKLMELCKKVCRLEMSNTYSTGQLKENLDISRDYIVSDYKLYWNYLKEEEFFA